MAVRAETRRLVVRRAGDRCEYCRLPASASQYPLHTEHVRARQHGGGDEAENLALACHLCNLHKGTNLTAIDPRSEAVTLLFNPRQMVWTDHFTPVGGEVLGITPEGRATAVLLDMNEASRLDLRIELVETGEWP